MEKVIEGYYKDLVGAVNEHRTKNGKDPIDKEREVKIAKAVELVIKQVVVKRLDLGQLISGKAEMIPWTKELAEDTITRCSVISAWIGCDHDPKEEGIIEKLKSDGVSDPEVVVEDVKHCLRELELRKA